MTNLEKIRQMSAEELTDFCLNDNSCDKCIYCNDEGNCGDKFDIGCAEGVKAWLNSEVEE